MARRACPLSSSAHYTNGSGDIIGFSTDTHFPSAAAILCENAADPTQWTLWQLRGTDNDRLLPGASGSIEYDTDIANLGVDTATGGTIRCRAVRSDRWHREGEPAAVDFEFAGVAPASITWPAS